MSEYIECETAGYEQPSQMPAKSVKQSFVIGGAAFEGCRGCQYCRSTVSVYGQQSNCQCVLQGAYRIGGIV